MLTGHVTALQYKYCGALCLPREQLPLNYRLASTGKSKVDRLEHICYGLFLLTGRFRPAHTTVTLPFLQH